MALIKTPGVPPPASEQHRQARDCTNLEAELNNASPAVRRWAARDLDGCANASAALVSRLQHEDDLSVREVILSTLTSIADPTAVSGLIACLASEDSALRNEAIDVMKQLPAAVAPMMQGLLHDGNADVRIFAVNILESLRHPDVESWLIEIIENDPQLNVCATAVDLLGEVGTPAARAALLQLRARYADEAYIEFATSLALSRIGAD